MEVRSMEDKHLELQKPFISRKKSVFIIIIILGLLLLQMLFVGSFLKFDSARQVEIKNGDSLKRVAIRLKEAGVVPSSSLLSTLVIIQGGESHIVSGIYSFEKKEGVVSTAKRLISGKTNIKATKVTFPEGFSSAQIARRIFEFFPDFDTEAFLENAKQKEGLLFPDTYFFLPNATSSEVIDRLESTFWSKTGEKFNWRKEDQEKVYKTLILASIIEEEVKELKDKKIVADIFLRRMKIGMALQADSTLAYVTGRDSLSLTVDDLKSDSPYNTYTNRGLPPTPISNPGLESIEAALNPTPNKYLYFLTDEGGKVYYAKTFDEHKQNKAKYLK